MTSNIPSEESAGFTRRVMALIYDFFLMLGVAFAYGIVITLIKKILGFDTLSPSSTLSGLLTLAGLWVLCSLLYIWCWQRSGQTLGMKSWRIELRNQRHGKLTLQQCWIRCLTATLSMGFGLIWRLIDRDKKALQDRLSATEIVLLPKAENPAK